MNFEIATPDSASLDNVIFELSSETFGLFLIRANNKIPIAIIVMPSMKNEWPSEKVVRKNRTIDGKKIPEKLDPEVAIPTGTLALLPYQLSSKSVIPDAPPRLYPTPITIEPIEYITTLSENANIIKPKPVAMVASATPIRQSSFLYQAAIKNIEIKLAKLRSDTIKLP